MDPAGGGVSNGYYGDNSSGGGGCGDEPQQQTKDDFEDYMWMANEEEAEKEMLKQIEDEQMAQKCYNEMLEEEERLVGLSAADQPNAWQPGQTGGWSTGCPPPMAQPQHQSQHQQQQPQPQQQAWSTCQTAAPPPEDALACDIGSLSVNDRPKMELNPMAAEFVPGQAFQPASG